MTENIVVHSFHGRKGTFEALEYVWGMIVHYEGRDVKLDDKSRRKRGRNGMTTIKVSHG